MGSELGGSEVAMCCYYSSWETLLLAHGVFLFGFFSGPGSEQHGVVELNLCSSETGES